MTKLSFTLAVSLAVANFAADAKDYSLHSFKKTQLTDKFWCEGATFGDLNRDGKPDIVSGPYWYEGPDFTNRMNFILPRRPSSVKKKMARLKPYRVSKERWEPKTNTRIIFSPSCWISTKTVGMTF